MTTSRPAVCLQWSAIIAAGVVAVAAGVHPLVVAAQERLGDEFQVNTYTTGFQISPAVATDGSGNFIVVWDSFGQDGNSNGTFGRRFRSNGVASGSDFQINTYTTSAQYRPAIAMDAAANFVVVWESLGQDGDDLGIFGKRFDSNGAEQGSEFQANVYTTNEQRRPSVAMADGGDFEVVWDSPQDGDGTGIRRRRYQNDGPVSSFDSPVNSYTTGDQSFPSVAMAADGRFVVVWDSYGQDGDGRGIFGQRFTSSGAATLLPFPVNTHTTSQQRFPSVAMDPDGAFVVVWASYGQDGNSFGIFVRRFTSNGDPVGPEFQVNTYTTGSQDAASVAINADGHFVIVWRSDGQDGSFSGIFGRRFISSGAPLGSEFQINTYTPNNQLSPSVALDDAGNFVVVWWSEHDGDGAGIFGQRFRFGELDFFIGDGAEDAEKNASQPSVERVGRRR